MHIWFCAALILSAAPLPDGSLVFLENCNSVVERSTGGEIGHVALAFSDQKTTWIYEATPAQVRRVTLAEYQAELARLNARRDKDDQIRVWALRPRKAYTSAEVAEMREFLAAQLGRRYSVENYVRRKPGKGVHCAELAATTLNSSGRCDYEDCHTLHPTALLALVQPDHLPAEELALPTYEKQGTWCERADRRWAEIWSWCRWSCGEAAALCRLDLFPG